jgi:hypothetical protein
MARLEKAVRLLANNEEIKRYGTLLDQHIQTIYLLGQELIL